MRRGPLRSSLAPFLLSTLLVASPRPAEAQTIRTPNGHPDYVAELEPHFTLAVFRNGLYGFDRGRRGKYFGTPGIGAGFRATFEVADPAFIAKLNNTVGITVGIDVTHCDDWCENRAVLYIPTGVQWNFFFSKEWAAFGEIGPMLRTDFDGVLPDLYVAAGGRYLFSDAVSLTLRIGFPFVTFGVSFFP